MTRARTLADLGSQSLATDAEATAAASAAAAAVPTGRKNLLYNGAMQVAQRGTSTAGITTNGYYTVDRWIDTGSGTQSTRTDAVVSDAPDGFGQSFKTLVTTANASPGASDLLLFSQSLEGQDVQRIAKGTSAAQQLTLSFWVKSNVTGTYVIGFRDLDNTRDVGASYTIDSSATWERKTITIPADTSGKFDNDNAGSLIVSFYLMAGSNFATGTLRTDSWDTFDSSQRAVGQVNMTAATNNYWQITGVQLEVGNTATDFEHKPFGVELAECQRYYQRIEPGGTSEALSTVGRITSTTTAQFAIPFVVPMRIAPSALEQSGTAADYQVNHTSTAEACTAVPTFGASTTDLFGVLNTTVASGLTNGQACLFTAAATSAYLAWSAEL